MGDAAALPTMEAYLRALPRGMDSFPTFEQKAVVYRSFIAAVDLSPHLASLPPVLRNLVAQPLAVGTWLPEVHATALYLAARDLLYTDDKAFLEDSYQINRNLLSGPFYGFLFKLISAETVVKGVRSRWGNMHRGIELETAPPAEGRGTVLRMKFAPRLVPPLMVGVYAEAFRAAVDVTGAANAKVTGALASDGLAVFTGSWS